MEYHYPAEFIVPTNIPFDVGPIGKAFETEFLQQEVDVGLLRQDMHHGLLVSGGTPEDRFITNFQLVVETVMAEGSYLILTQNPEWRRLITILPDAAVWRLGIDLTLNPLDPEEADPVVYTTLLAQAFAQAFQLSRLGYERFLECLQILLLETSQPPDVETLKFKLQDLIKDRTLGGYYELNTILQFLLNSAHGKMSTCLGPTNLPLRRLLQGVHIIEIETIASSQFQFLLLCYLAKILAVGRTATNPCMILIDNADVLVPFDPQLTKVRELEPHWIDWIQQFQHVPLGLHLNLQSPAGFPLTLLNSFKTILTHRTTAWNDLRVLRDLLQLLPDNVVHSRQRHDNYQIEYLKTLEIQTLLLKRPDIPDAFPVKVQTTHLERTHPCTNEDVQNRLDHLFPHRTTLHQPARTMLERHFGTIDAPFVRNILGILMDYPELGKQALFSTLCSDPQFSMDLHNLEHYLHRLVGLGYIIANEWDDRRGHRHISYQIRDAGEYAYQEYLTDLPQRIRDPNSQNR